MTNYTFHITGMTCHACETLITMDLEDAGFRDMQVSHESGTLVIPLADDAAVARVREIVEASNEKKYTITDVKPTQL